MFLNETFFLTWNMKIGMLCFYHPHLGGSGIVSRRLAKALAEKGHEIRIIAYPDSLEYKNVITNPSMHPNIHLHAAKKLEIPVFKPVPYTITRAGRIVSLCKKYDLDIIHVNYAIPHAVSAFLAKQVINVPTFITLHGTDAHTYGLLKSIKPILRLCLEKSDHISAVSKYLAEFAQRELEINKSIDVIYNFIDTNIFKKKDSSVREEFNISKDAKVVTHASNFRPIKDTPTLVKSANLVLKKFPKTIFLMVGKGPELDPIKDLAKQFNIYDSFRFIGERKKMSKIYNSSDIFVLSSLNEGFGLVIAEAMACQVPVVATSVGGVPEVVEDGVDGYLVPPQDPNEMAEKIIKLLKDDDLREKFGRNARRNVQTKFDKDKIVNQYIKTYEDTIKSK